MIGGLCIVVAGTALVAGVVLGRWHPRAWLALTVGGALAGLAGALLVLVGGGAWEWRSSIAIGGEPLHLRLDAISAFFVVLLALIGGVGAVYAREYWSDAERPASAGRGRLWWSAQLLSMGAVFVASNGLHFLFAWELFAVSAYFLITLDSRARAVRRAGWLYLAASHVGTLCLFAFFALLAHRTGSWDLGPMRTVAAGGGVGDGLGALFWLALVGFGVKAGVFPLHVWLPSAHANAPSHVSAILSGVALKLGIYGIVRFSGWLPVPPAAGWVLLGVGGISAVVGIAFALAQDDLKRLLAYCSVENVGVILTGLGAALVASSHGAEARAWGALAYAGALLHVWNHGAFKALLFLSAGSVLHATGTREMSRLGGLWRTMPWTAGAFALGAVAVSGLPPLNGFVSEWLIYLGLFDAVATRSPAAWAAIPGVLLLGTAGALALATFVKAASIVFLGAARTRRAEHAHECGPLMRGAMIALAAICALLAFAPALLLPVLMRVARAWWPGEADAAAIVPLKSLGAANLLVAAAVGMGVIVLLARVRRNGLGRSCTWDCGYAGPSPRMQYTSSSFAGLATRWFFWILRPERRLRRPRGPVPEGAVLVERHPETMLDRVLQPAGAGVLAMSTAVRRLQHGRLQSYLVYIMAGIVALALIVLLGGSQ